jgi:CheY-like chemotaxis protein
MKHGAYGSAVLRSHVLMLDDGNPVLLWTGGRVQELLTGRMRELPAGEYAQPASDHELSHLVQRGVVASFTSEQVWLTALLEERQPAVVRPLKPAAPPSPPVYYLHTQHPAPAVHEVRERIIASGLQTYLYASVRQGIVAITAPGGRPFSSSGDAELAVSLLARNAPDLLPAFITFAEGRDARRTTTELVAAVVQQEAPALSFDELAASQTGSEITRGQCALVLCAEPAEQRVVAQSLRELEMQTVMAETAWQALDVLISAAREPIHVIVVDVMTEQSPGWALLEQLRMLPAEAPPVIALADAMTLTGAQAGALRLAGVHVLVERPCNAARLRLKVFELLQERSAWRGR